MPAKYKTTISRAASPWALFSLRDSPGDNKFEFVRRPGVETTTRKKFGMGKS